jgi:hypothetical protein
LALTLGQALLQEHKAMPVLLMVIDAEQEHILDVRLESLMNVSALMAAHEKPFPTLQGAPRP